MKSSQWLVSTFCSSFSRSSRKFRAQRMTSFWTVSKDLEVVGPINELNFARLEGGGHRLHWIAENAGAGQEKKKNLLTTTRRVRPPNGGRPSHWLKLLPQTMQYVNALSPHCWGTGGGWGVGWKWAPIGGLQYQTQMQSPTYDVHFLRSEALRSSSSSSSRTRQIKECKILT